MSAFEGSRSERQHRAVVAAAAKYDYHPQLVVPVGPPTPRRTTVTRAHQQPRGQQQPRQQQQQRQQPRISHHHRPPLEHVPGCEKRRQEAANRPPDGRSTRSASRGSSTRDHYHYQQQQSQCRPPSRSASRASSSAATSVNKSLSHTSSYCSGYESSEYPASSSSAVVNNGWNEAQESQQRLDHKRYDRQKTWRVNESPFLFLSRQASYSSTSGASSASSSGTSSSCSSYGKRSNERWTENEEEDEEEDEERISPLRDDVKITSKSVQSRYENAQAAVEAYGE